MKALITGSHGFIGRHLMKRLNDEGYEIVTIGHQKLKDFSYLQGFIHEIRPDAIFHLAAYGNMSHQQDEDEIMAANITGTYNLLQATKNINYTIFINVSSSSVYGYKDTRMSEEDRLCPNTLYAATKASAEHLCRYFRKKYKKTIVSVRPFSVYGPGEADFRFIPTLINNEKKKQRSQVVKGNHDWIYIDDFINGMMKILENYQNLPHRTFNIGTGVMTNNREVASLISTDYDYVPERKPGDSYIWCADTRRLSSLNWKPAVTIQEGIKKTYESSNK